MTKSAEKTVPGPKIGLKKQDLVPRSPPRVKSAIHAIEDPCDPVEWGTPEDSDDDEGLVTRSYTHKGLLYTEVRSPSPPMKERRFALDVATSDGILNDMRARSADVVTFPAPTEDDSGCLMIPVGPCRTTAASAVRLVEMFLSKPVDDDWRALMATYMVKVRPTDRVRGDAYRGRTTVQGVTFDKDSCLNVVL